MGGSFTSWSWLAQRWLEGSKCPYSSGWYLVLTGTSCETSCGCLSVLTPHGACVLWWCFPNRGENCSSFTAQLSNHGVMPSTRYWPKDSSTSPDLFRNKCLLSVEEQQRMCRHQSTFYPQMIYIPLTWKPHPLPSPALCPKFYSTMASSSGLKSRILSSKSCSEYYGTTPLRFLEAFLSSWEEALP